MSSHIISCSEQYPTSANHPYFKTLIRKEGYYEEKTNSYYLYNHYCYVAVYE